MTTVEMLKETAKWQSRPVSYFRGDWDAIQRVIPEFELGPFQTGQDEPINPYLRTVIRKPLTPAERPTPVGVVSNTYTLASHHQVADLCRKGMVEAGIPAKDLVIEAGLSALGEWMNFRIYAPKQYAFRDGHGQELRLRLECYNSVEGSSRLIILLGWLRFVCANGLVIGETKMEVRERHGVYLDLDSIPHRIGKALGIARADKERMARWARESVAIEDIRGWADKPVSAKWGKKAAARVFHICDAGKDVEFVDPFAPGSATQKPVTYLLSVPGSPARSQTKYDVGQALSYVATHRNNAEQRFEWQSDVPWLLSKLKTMPAQPELFQS